MVLNKNSAGFTLIELMVVVAIIGILSTMALPPLHNRLIRSQVEEGLSVAKVATKAVEDYFLKSGGAWPEDNRQAGLPVAEKFVGNYVSSITVHQGVVKVIMGNRVNRFVKGQVVLLRPAFIAEEPKVPIAWVCGEASTPKPMQVKRLTPEEKSGLTLIKREFLPWRCRL
ncbi:pilin [Magnetococcales bacterium HHB-1]